MNLALDPKINFQMPAGADGKTPDSQNPEDLKQACRSFESVLLNTMFQNMRKTVPDDGYIESGPGMDFYEEMLYSEAAGQMAGNGGLGLGDLLYEQFTGSENKP